MARARTGKRTKQKKKARARAQAPRRRRGPRVKAHRGPVQLWLPLQMPLGLEGGQAVAPASSWGAVAQVEDAPSGAQGAPGGEQVSLFE